MGEVNYLKLLMSFIDSFSPLKHLPLESIPAQALYEWNKVYEQNPDAFKDVICVYPSYFSEVNGQYEPLNKDKVSFWLNPISTEQETLSIQNHVESYFITNVQSISRYFVINSKVSVQFKITGKQGYINNKLVFTFDDVGEVDLTDKSLIGNDINQNVKGINVENINSGNNSNLELPRIYNLDSNLEELSSSFRIHIPLAKYFSDIYYIFSGTNKIEAKESMGYGGIFLLFKNKPTDLLINCLQIISEYISLSVAFNITQKQKRNQQFRTAVISILVDSFAHNISAHSLVALENWFRKRSEQLENKIYINEDVKPIEFSERLISEKIVRNTGESAARYYSLLGLNDQSNTKEYVSLNDIIRLNGEELEKIFTANVKHAKRASDHVAIDNPVQLPIPIDYAIWPFIKFMKGKAAFWSGVTRDLPFGGESISLYDLLYNELINNPLYLGTIVASEGITKLNFKIALGNGFEDQRVFDFAQINLDIMNHDTSKESQEAPHNSKYNFIRFKDDFETIRNTLTAEYAFVPGGIVGIHSFLTIVENTLRNVKHYKHLLLEMQENGVDIIISFEKMDLFHIYHEEGKIQNVKTNNGDVPYESKHRLYRTGIGIGHEIEKKNDKNEYPEQLIREQLYEDIIGADGKAKLGGTSQDKVCAAMLLNNRFISVENAESETPIRDYFYFAWLSLREINIDDLTTSNNCELEHYNTLRSNIFGNNRSELNLHSKKNSDFQNVDKRNCGAGNYLFKYFNIWKAEDVNYKANDKSENDFVESVISSCENQSRFKINVYETEEELLKDRKEVSTSFRAITKAEIPDNIEEKSWFQEAYKAWNKKIFSGEAISVTLSELKSDNSESEGITIKIDEEIEDTINKNLLFAHGTNTNPEKALNYRSHGVLLEKFSMHSTNLYLGIKEDKINEFLETCMLQVKIWDNRIWNIVSNKFMGQTKFGTFLNLWIYGENDFHETVQPVEINENLHTVYVIHGSYIEDLFKQNKGKISIEQLIDTHFVDDDISISNPYTKDQYQKFSIFVTSGKGSIEWYDKLNPKYKEFVFFRPIEALQNSVSDAIYYGDDFQLKYNIVKTLFGN